MRTVESRRWRPPRWSASLRHPVGVSRSRTTSGQLMTTRRDVLQLGALGAAGLAGIKVEEGSSGDVPSQLAPQNTPVPYRGVFRRPPELVPYATTYDGGDPSRPVDHFALTERLGQVQILPGLSTPVAGYNGIFPGPTIRAKRGTRIELRMRNGFPDGARTAPAAADGHLRPPARLAVASPVRRVRQRHHGARLREDLQVPQRREGEHPLVPRPPAHGHGPERVLGAGGLLPVLGPATSGSSCRRASTTCP